jgi:hypothetical protein
MKWTGARARSAPSPRACANRDDGTRGVEFTPRSYCSLCAARSGRHSYYRLVTVVVTVAQAEGPQERKWVSSFLSRAGCVLTSASTRTGDNGTCLWKEASDHGLYNLCTHRGAIVSTAAVRSVRHVSDVRFASANTSDSVATGGGGPSAQSERCYIGPRPRPRLGQPRDPSLSQAPGRRVWA